MDDSRQDIITKLKFLSRVSKGQRINVKEMILQDESWLTTASRTVWNIDNRNNTMTFIQNTITSAFNMIGLLLRSETVGDRQICKTIVGDIIASKKGIRNLKGTYTDDTYFCCGVDTYIQMIDAHMTDLKSKHSELFEGINLEEVSSTFSSPKMDGLSAVTGSLSMSPELLNISVKKED